MSKKAFFFDRDGIINKRIIDAYVTKVEEFELNPDIPQILEYIKSNDYLLILVTNQQGVSKGLMTQTQLDKVHDYMQELLLKSSGVCFDEIYYCTDLKSSNSFRRKPNPGMLLEAAENLGIDNKQSFMIGDTESDIIAGKSAGTKTILISNENVTTTSDYHLKSLNELMPLLIKLIEGKL